MSILKFSCVFFLIFFLWRVMLNPHAIFGSVCKMKNTGWASINLRSPKYGKDLNFHPPEMQLFLKPTSKSLSWRLGALGLGKWSFSILVCSPLLDFKNIFLFPTSSFPTLSYTNLSSFYIRSLYCRGCCTVASLVAQTIKDPPAMQETWVWPLCQEGPLEKGMATHSSILARKSHGESSLAGYSSWITKSWTWLEQLTLTVQVNSPLLVTPVHLKQIDNLLYL